MEDLGWEALLFTTPPETTVKLWCFWRLTALCLFQLQEKIKALPGTSVLVHLTLNWVHPILNVVHPTLNLVHLTLNLVHQYHQQSNF